jgi:hypothetical protein
MWKEPHRSAEAEDALHLLLIAGMLLGLPAAIVLVLGLS